MGTDHAEILAVWGQTHKVTTDQAPISATLVLLCGLLHPLATRPHLCSVGRLQEQSGTYPSLCYPRTGPVMRVVDRQAFANNISGLDYAVHVKAEQDWRATAISLLVLDPFFVSKGK